MRHTGAVINEMQVHRVMCRRSVVRRNGIGQHAVRVDGFLFQRISGQLDQQRDCAVDDRDQAGNDNIFAAQCNRRVKFNVFLGVVLSQPDKILDFLAEAAKERDIFFGCVLRGKGSNRRLQEKTDFQGVLCQFLFVGDKEKPSGSSTIPGVWEI